MILLEIKSSINYSEYGKEVVTNVTFQYDQVIFIENGLETIEIDSDFEAIEIIVIQANIISVLNQKIVIRNL